MSECGSHNTLKSQHKVQQSDRCPDRNVDHGKTVVLFTQLDWLLSCSAWVNLPTFLLQL